MNDLAKYERDVERMFDTFDRQLTRIGQVFTIRLAAELIATTPGPNLQYPEDTEYIATGRLRAAWDYGQAALGHVSRRDGGPYTEHGDDTLSQIEGKVFAAGLRPISYLTNDVMYGYIVHEGLGRHTIARPWVKITAERMEYHARAARLEVMRSAA